VLRTADDGETQQQGEKSNGANQGNEVRQAGHSDLLLRIQNNRQAIHLARELLGN
jgi:hypothetical protein